jgi:putative Holliday junction resolvase
MTGGAGPTRGEQNTPGRVLALDVGTRRLGVAVSDPTGTLASPLVTLQRGTVEADAAALARLVTEHEATLIVAGLPVALNGREELAARTVRDYLAALTPHLPPHVTFELSDERMTTVVAQRSLAAAGMPGRRRKDVVDQLAASVILQGWLDRRRGGPGG